MTLISRDAGVVGANRWNPATIRARERYRAIHKRLLDLTLVVLFMPVLLPLLLLLMTVVSMDGGRPFYSQTRLGRHGRKFRIWKLRSMVCDADARLETHLQQDQAARAEWDQTQKLKCDPRVTLVGRFIRKCSLDELPQLWNVLVGDMSLVGPRPMMLHQASIYPGTAYFELRPGLTGLWQVSKRNETSFADRAWYDAEYAARMSLSLDLKLLVATVPVVLRGTGY